MKTRARNLTVLGLALATVVLVAGSASAMASTKSVARPSAKKELTVAYVTGDEADPYFITERCGAQAEANKLSVHLSWYGSTSTEVAVEYQNFQAAQVAHPNAIVLAPFSNAGFSGSINSLMKKGVPVSLTGAQVTPKAGYQAVEANLVQGGLLLEKVIVNATGGSGKIAVIAQSTGNPPDAERYMQLLKDLKKNHPKIDVLPIQYGEADTSTAASIASGLILGNPGLKLIYATNGPDAIGAESAIAAAGDTGKIKLVSFDSTPQQVSFLKQGKLLATVAQTPYYTAALGVQSVVDYLRTHRKAAAVVPAKHYLYNTPLFLMTPQNVKTKQAQKFVYSTSCPS